jgi:dihydroorotate dehydrogenase
MNDKYIGLRNGFIHFVYTKVLKPVFFLNDPEDVHDNMVKMGNNLGRHSIGRAITKAAFNYKNPMLEQKVLGISFKNPIGLAAGFDKNAQLTQILPSVGFGFEEVGSITGEPCKGNPKPRLWRLKESKGLVVYYGLKNDGCEVLSQRLCRRKFEFPLGISIAKTNSPDTCETDAGVADYVKAYTAFRNIGNYYTINVSCPNAFGGQPFTDALKLEKLLTAIDSLPKTKPIFIKISPDLSQIEIDAVLNVVKNHSIDGFVISNLTKNRENQNLKDKNIPEVGGFSGKVVEDLANKMIKYVYSETKGKYVIIGCGGVFNAEDAFEKIKSGASLIQLVTGMIFEGPQVIGEINRGLVKILQKNGYKNISEAVGKSN